MTAARILERVQFGYAKAGQKLGLLHTLYRPTAPLTPALAPQNRMRALPFASTATPDASFRQPSKYGAPERYGLFDVRGVGPVAVQVGDYIDGPTGTLFVASLEGDTIPLVVDCNAVLSVMLPPEGSLAQEDTYGGWGGSDDGTAKLLQYPASLIRGGRTVAGRADLPGDVPSGGFVAKFPALFGVVIGNDDWVRDQDGRRYTVSSAERTGLGWRIDLTQSDT